MLPGEELFAAPHHPNGPAQARRAAHLLPSGGCPEATPNPRAGASSQLRAARSSIGAKRAV